jgi:hypothetical protein
MAYAIRENDFARFELVNLTNGDVVATSYSPDDLCTLATKLLPPGEFSCLPPATSGKGVVVEELTGGVQRTVIPILEGLVEFC